MRGRVRLFPDTEQAAQQTAQYTRGLPHHDLHPHHLLSLRQITPQAMSKNETRNIRHPTGNTAAIRIPSPSPSAHTPIKPPQFHLLTVHPSPVPLYGPVLRGVQLRAKKGPPQAVLFLYALLRYACRRPMRPRSRCAGCPTFRRYPHGRPYGRPVRWARAQSRCR